MREILFRGKGDTRYNNGDWYYGVPIQDHNGDWQICNYALKRTVIPETVGQYTGLTDKNGTKIFEGDIVETDEAGWVAEVTYERDIFMCRDKKGGFSYECNWEGFEVLGNIHDNPELMENKCRQKN